MPANIRYSLFKIKSKNVKKKADTKGKIRVGIIVGPKNCDPILKGTEDPAYPKALKLKNNFGANASGWGGAYQIDTNLGMKLQRAYPNVFEVDIVPGSQLSQSRLASNHINFNLGYDMINAFMAKDPKHFAAAGKAFKSPDSRLFPEWDYQDWIYCKERYLFDCQKNGVKIAPTIYLKNGIKPQEILKKVQAKGWSRFFIKPAHLCSFGFAGGKFNTKECLADNSILKNFAKNEANDYKDFLIQPFMMKPNGDVFDEVRVWFINGKWSYSIYTDGTDDDAVYPLLPGKKGAHLIKPTRAMAEKAYKCCQKVLKWRGKNVNSAMTRVDVGVIPVGKSKTKVTTFINEIETEAATWLVRYVPYDICKHMVSVYPEKIQEFIKGLKPGEKRPDADAMAKLAELVDKLAGEKKTSAAAAGKRKRSSTGASASAKRAKKA